MSTATVEPIPVVSPAPAVSLPRDWNLADLCRHLWGIPPERIRLFPSPGTATEDDVLEIQQREGRLCELEDGILVEKTMGWYESGLAGLILTELVNFLREHKLGRAFPPDGAVKLLSGKIKIPDVSFISWKRFADVPKPMPPIPHLIPDLAVEVLSKSNTKAEMLAKLKTYFDAGVRLVWYVDPETRSARMFTSPKSAVDVAEDGFLEGGEVLPGLRISLHQLFAEADRQEPA